VAKPVSAFIVHFPGNSIAHFNDIRVPPEEGTPVCHIFAASASRYGFHFFHDIIPAHYTAGQSGYPQ